MLRRTAQRLELALTGEVVARSDLRWPTAATVDLVGTTVLGTRSYGKHLLTRFDDGRTLHTHLRMDGYWRVYPTGSSQAAARSPQVRAVIATQAWTAVGHHLGMLDVVRTRDEHTVIGRLGPDLLGETVDADEALRRWTSRGADARRRGPARPAGRRRHRHHLLRGVAVRRAHLALDARRPDHRPRAAARRGPPPAPAIGRHRSTAGTRARTAAAAVRPVRDPDRGGAGAQATDGTPDLLLPALSGPRGGLTRRRCPPLVPEQPQRRPRAETQNGPRTRSSGRSVRANCALMWGGAPAPARLQGRTTGTAVS